MGDYREKVRCRLKFRMQANQLRVELDTTSRNAKKTHENWQVEPGGWLHRVFRKLLLILCKPDGISNPIPALRNSHGFS